MDYHPGLAVAFTEMHRNDLIRQAEASRLAAHVRAGGPSLVTRMRSRAGSFGRIVARATARPVGRTARGTHPACATC